MGKNCLSNVRVNGIDGLDIAAIMGVVKNRTIRDVYLEKIISGESDVDYSNLKEATEEEYWLQTVNEMIAQEYSVRKNKKVRKENKVLFDNEYDFMLRNVDRKLVGENSILMCKAENAFLVKEWNGGEVPASYILEAQHNIRVCKAEKCIIASLIGGKKFVCKEIVRDDKVIDMIIKVEKDFWVNNVLTRIPPKDGN